MSTQLFGVWEVVLGRPVCVSHCAACKNYELVILKGTIEVIDSNPIDNPIGKPQKFMCSSNVFVAMVYILQYSSSAVENQLKLYQFV